MDGLAIAERTTFGADDLIVFMTLPGHKDDIALAGESQSVANRIASIVNNRGANSLRESSDDVCHDPRSRFATRVIVRDDDAVGHRRSDARHQRSLADITIASASENEM
jgi:hypothetical protein